MPKKSVFTRLLGVFRNFIMRGRCLAPKRRALPTAPHPDNGSDSHILVCFILRFTIISKHGEFVKIFRGFETRPSLIFFEFYLPESALLTEALNFDIILSVEPNRYFCAREWYIWQAKRAFLRKI